MDARRGSILVVPSKKVGQPERRGTIEQVTRTDTGPRLWVRWEDGSRTLFQPHGAYQILEAKKR